MATEILTQIGNEFGRAVEMLLVGGEGRSASRLRSLALILLQDANGLRGEIHVVAGVSRRRRGNLRNRTIMLHLIGDVADQRRERREGAFVDFMRRDVARDRRARIADHVIAGRLGVDDFRGRLRMRDEAAIWLSGIERFNA